MSGRMMQATDGYWDAQLETLPRDELRRVQDHRLQWQMQRCWLGSPFYRRRLERANLEPRAVRDVADLARLPILTDRELVRDYEAHAPLGSATVAPDVWWAERERLDGPDGVELVLTDGDLVHRAGLAARALWAAGVRSGRANAESVEPHTVGPRAADAIRRAANAGLSTLGAAPEGAAPASTASAGAASSEEAASEQVWPSTRVAWHLAADSAHLAVGGGRLDAASASSTDSYMVLGHPRIGTVMAFECAARSGLHWAEDHYLLEVLDPATFARVPDGRAGALAVSHLTREGSPLIRYWTGWEAALDRTPCPCGRTGARSATIAPRR